MNPFVATFNVLAFRNGHLYGSNLRKVLTKKETNRLDEVLKKAEQYIIINEDIETYKGNTLEYEHQKSSSQKRNISPSSLKKRNFV